MASARVLDTRTGVGVRAGRVAAHGSISFATTGVAGVPSASALSAVVFNLTATNTAAAGYVSAYPAGAAAPPTSTLNFAAGETRAHSVVVAPGTSGKVTLRNASAGALDLLADITGYYTAGSPTAGGEFAPLTSARVLDTRIGLGAAMAPMHHGDALVVQLAGRGGIPASGVSAVALNVTATESITYGYLNITSDGYTGATSVNFWTGKTVSNLVVAALSATGTMTVRSFMGGGVAGGVQVVADVAGYFRSGPPSAAGRLGSLNPARLLDTRFGSVNKIPAHGTRTLAVAGQPDIPQTGINAAVLNIAVAAPTGSGYVTAYPSGTTRPRTSTVNFSRHTAANLALVAVGSDGTVQLYNGSSAPIDLVVDISGFIGPIPGPLTWSARTAFPPGSSVNAVSCANPTFCAAADGNGAVFFFDGTTWSLPQTVTTEVLDAISCPVAGFCVALAPDAAFVDTAGTWTRMTLPGSPDSLTTISCRSASFCLAAADYDEPRAWFFNGSAWTVTDTGLPAGGGEEQNPNSLTLTCAPTTFCLAIGSDGGTARFDGTTWTVLSTLDPFALSISCPSATSCVAVSLSEALTFDGTNWGTPKQLAGFADFRDHMTGVDCGSPTFCIGYTQSFGNLLFYNGATWTTPVTADLLGVQDVSCPAANFCVAVDASGASVGT